VEIAPAAAPHALMVENVDRPGAVGRVGTLLGEHGVNISYMSVASGSADRALMVLGVNRALTREELDALARLENVFSTRQLDLS
jgi:D-3-phosphoglycerate dehydrogenase